MTFTRIFLIVFGYGSLVIGLAFLVVWGMSRWYQHEALAEQARRRTLERVMQASEPSRAAGMSSKRVN